ncbi:MAG: TonB-dependent receptor [Deltaproteobacteria bacterium]|nr:TonB-dependent receptor [Deltaproteobacteria bacterium]
MPRVNILRAGTLALVALAAPAAVRAEDPPDQEVVALEPIDVQAPAEPTPAAVAENPSRFVEVVDADAVREGAQTAADVVEDVAGVRVRRHGGLGSFAVVSIRGSSPSQVPIFVDGVPVGDARSGMVGLEQLASVDLERIEVYRGFAPPTLGEAGIGGAVNLVTRAAPDGGAAELSSGMSAGSFDTWRGWASLRTALADSQAGEPVAGLRLTFAALRTAGDYTFVSDHGTPLEPSDDLALRRINNDFLQTSAAARLSVPLDHWSLDGSLSLVRNDQGLPGLDYDQAERTRLEGTDARLRLSASAPALAGGLLALEVGVYASLRADRFADPAGELGVGRQVQDDLTAGGGAWASSTFFLGDGSHLLRARLETSYESFRPSYDFPAPADGPRQGRWLLRLGAGYEVSLLDDELVLLADFRADSHVDSFEGDAAFPSAAGDGGSAWDVLFSPSAGLRWTAFDGFELRANVGWFHRVPTFGELFGDRGTVVGNPGLRPESAWNVDAGPSWHWRDAATGLRLRATAAFFASFADELIVFVPQSQSVFRAENIGSSRTLGAEATLELSWNDTLAVDVRYAFQEARDTGDAPYWSGLRLPGRAPHDVSSRISLRRWGVELWYEADYLAEAPLDRSNLRSVPGRLLHGAGASWRLDRDSFGLALTVEGRNLVDTPAFDAFRYPLPGRSFFASFSLRM